jgi:hypothetical protein
MAREEESSFDNILLHLTEQYEAAIHNGVEDFVPTIFVFGRDKKAEDKLVEIKLLRLETQDTAARESIAKTVGKRFFGDSDLAEIDFIYMAILANVNEVKDGYVIDISQKPMKLDQYGRQAIYITGMSRWNHANNTWIYLDSSEPDAYMERGPENLCASQPVMDPLPYLFLQGWREARENHSPVNKRATKRR